MPGDTFLFFPSKTQINLRAGVIRLIGVRAFLLSSNVRRIRYLIAIAFVEESSGKLLTWIGFPTI